MMPMESAVAAFVVRKLAEQGAVTGPEHDVLGRALSALGLDSLDFMELLNEIEEEFDIRIEDDTMSATTTVAGLITFIEGRLAARETSCSSDDT